MARFARSLAARVYKVKPRVNRDPVIQGMPLMFTVHVRIWEVIGVRLHDMEGQKQR